MVGETVFFFFFSIPSENPKKTRLPLHSLSKSCTDFAPVSSFFYHCARQKTIDSDNGTRK